MRADVLRKKNKFTQIYQRIPKLTPGFLRFPQQSPGFRINPPNFLFSSKPFFYFNENITSKIFLKVRRFGALSEMD